MKTHCQRLKPKEITTVIICIIMLLCTMSAIAQRSREHHHQLTCYAQMMSLLDAWTQYAEDNDGQLSYNNPEHIRASGGRLSWVATSPSNLEDEIDGITQGALFPYIGDVDTYHCPADTRLYDPNQRAYRSYSISNTMSGTSTAAVGTAIQWMDEVQNPASALVFLEEPDSRGANIGSWLLHLRDKKWIDPVATWHSQACNLGFADGHVERRRWQNQSTLDWGTAAQYADPSFMFAMTPEDGFEDYDYMRSIYEIEMNRED